MKSDRAPLTLSRLILCEGPDDIAFFQELIAAHSIGVFNIRDTSPVRGAAAGNTRFRAALQALKLDAGFGGVREIVVVSDCDEDPAGSFTSIQTQINGVWTGKAPSVPDQRVHIVGHLHLRVMMMPRSSEVGNLETLLLPAAQRANAMIAGHVNNFSALIGSDSWTSLSRQNELKLRVNLAARSSSDPFVYLGTAIRRSLVPLTDPVFAPIVTVLNRVVADSA